MAASSTDKPSVLLVGGGGHCRAVIDVLEAAGLGIAGIVHGPDADFVPILGYPPLGRDSDLSALRRTYPLALVTVGQIKSVAPRKKLFALLRQLDFGLPCVVSPHAYVSRHASVGAGSVVMHMAVINAGASVGANCIINSKCLVEHDCTIADHCHISVGAIVCGGVSVGAGTFVGAGAIIRQNVRIGENVIVGCGVTVQADVADGQVLKGGIGGKMHGHR